MSAKAYNVAPGPFRFKGKVTRVVDGDTVDVELDLGFRMFTTQRLRLRGIDTPEIHGVPAESEEFQRGQRAKTHLELMLSQRDGNVIVVTRKTGKFGRWIADLFIPHEAGETHVNAAMIRDGHAVQSDG